MSAPAAAMPATPVPPWARVQTVWELCQRVRHRLANDEHLADAWVRGEVSNTKHAPSGHAYFTLKDDHAQVRCILWDAAHRAPFEVRDGLGLLVRGRVTLYEARGDVQLIAEELHPDGQGRLHLAFEQLKQRLAAEGLFDKGRKRPLPRFPARVALVTSVRGAALRDMLRILAARFPLAQVVVRDARVQGDGAAEELASAIRLVNRHRCADVLVVGRGGGSLEDLWAFNTEAVARAVAASEIPVVSAVGHETDISIADFVADHRAATPSNAAEQVVPDARDILHRLALHEERLLTRASALLDDGERQVGALERRAALRRPSRLLEGWAQRLDEGAWGLAEAAGRRLRTAEERLARAATLLDSYSPLRTLQRGYAIVSIAGRPAVSVARLAPGTEATVRVADGEVRVVVRDA